jgi:hypothetical protein
MMSLLIGNLIKSLGRSPDTEHSTKHRKHVSRVKIDTGNSGRAPRSRRELGRGHLDYEDAWMRRGSR